MTVPAAAAENAPLWTANLPAVNAERAALLIAAQFPDLAPVRVEPLGEGWDNAAFRVNGNLLFRFPRRQVAVKLLETENRLLPYLAPRLPLPVPMPTRIGKVTDDYPLPFAGYPFLPGTTACSVPLTDADRAACAVPLARFLAALHGLPSCLADESVPGDELNRADFPNRLPGFVRRLEEIADELPPGIAPDAVRTLAERLVVETPPWDGTAYLVHGDLYARHLLVDDARRPCGVIDWGDVHLGDRALDLSIAFSFLPPGAARAAFRAAYGPLDDGAWNRARFRALHYGVLLTHYGREIGDAAIRGAGETALRFAAA